jgi:hypothetical protein
MAPPLVTAVDVLLALVLAAMVLLVLALVAVWIVRGLEALLCSVLAWFVKAWAELFIKTR